MKRAIEQFITLCCVILAAVVLFFPTLVAPNPVSSDTNEIHAVFGNSKQNLILLKRGAIDTDVASDLDTSNQDRSNLSLMNASNARQTRLIQFAGYIRSDWIEALLETGVEIVGYVPNNAYIISGYGRQLARVADLAAGNKADDAKPIRWMGRLSALQKLDPKFTDEILSVGGANLDVEIELIDSADVESTIEAINRMASSVNREPRRFLNYVVLSVTLSVERLINIANLDEVLFAGPSTAMSLHDERGAQIIAGNLNPEGTQPNGPGYTDWLASKGLSGPSNFVIDFTDSGLDRGSTASSLLHPDFRDSANQSRVPYIFNYASDGQTDDRRGHGTIIASIAGGRGLSDREDGPGYMYGLGVDPGALLGASRIFDRFGRMPGLLSFTTVVSTAYGAGARISNNSWGNSSNEYDTTAQQFDSLVRDARPTLPGNQEMVFVFSAGNGGPGGHISSPATAKNGIAVGASENYRPEGTDACNIDGNGPIGPEGADNARDILRFSSGGPTRDGRAKPDIAAPGTHVIGAATQASGFFGDGLCAGAGLFQPPNQSLYTWSSGTSLAAPHISGAASLVRRYFVAHNLLGDNRAPSPAMTKACLLNSASYMSGENAGGNLPNERQGWGLADLSRAFDGTARQLVDQTQLFTQSGQTFEIQGSLADRGKGLRVTLVWTDAPGTLLGPAIVNDLDLELTVGGVTIYRGNNFAAEHTAAGGVTDRLNNVESIYLPPESLPAGVEGNFTITVRATNIAGDGVPGNETNFDQDFALVVYNIAPTQQTPPPPPPPKKVPVITGVTYIKKTITIAGRDFTAVAQVEINGQVISKPFEFNSTANTLGLRLKPRKLNFVEGANQIVLIENGERSQPFIFVW